MKKITAVILALAFMVTLAACSGTGAKTESKATFKIGAIPDQNLTELNKNMDLMARYLAEETGLEVEFVPSSDYAALVTGFQRGDIQLAWFGGLTGVQARSQAPGSEAIAQRPLDAEFKSVFICQAGLELNKLEDLKGKTFTFGSESSTSGSLMPRYYMIQSGIDPENDLMGQPNYSGSHDKTIQLVESGAFQTGALNISVWNKLVRENKVDSSKVKVFYTTPEYYDYNWTINSDIDKDYGKGTAKKIKEAILGMSIDGSEIEKAVLGYYQTDKFIESKNNNYKMIEDVARNLGMIN